MEPIQRALRLQAGEHHFPRDIGGEVVGISPGIFNPVG